MTVRVSRLSMKLAGTKYSIAVILTRSCTKRKRPFCSSLRHEETCPCTPRKAAIYNKIYSPVLPLAAWRRWWPRYVWAAGCRPLQPQASCRLHCSGSRTSPVWSLHIHSLHAGENLATATAQCVHHLIYVGYASTKPYQLSNGIG